MPKEPIIFLSFANDREGQFLEALRPEQDVLQSTLIPYQQKKWGNFYTAATSEPDKLIRDLNQYNGQLIIFHFSGHNDGVNLQLEDEKGKPIPFNQSRLQAFLKTEKNLKLVFLNACASKHHVKSLQEAGIPAVIATDKHVDDEQARKFSTSFYDSLVAGNSLEQAFDKAKGILDSETDESYIYRGINWDAIEGDNPSFLWGLHILRGDILSWKLEDDAPKAIRTTQALNKLPGLPMDFVGRNQDLQELQQLLEKEKPVLLLNGLGGIGKTTLARQYLHDNYDRFDHIAWVSVLSEQEKKESSFETAAEALGNDIELFRSLEIPFHTEENTAARASRILSALRTKRGNNLLVIDNAGFSLEDIRTELPQPPNWQVLITSRKELSGLSVKRLDELPPAEALELFYLHYPQGKNQAEDVEALLKHIGYHTLTLELFAKTCQKSPSTHPAKVLKLLQNQDLEKLSRKVFAEHSNREVEVYSYLLAAFELHELTEEELSVLIQWAILPPQEIPWELLCQIFEIEEAAVENFEDRVISLQAKGWIEKGQGGESYRIHQLIQEVLRYKHEPNEENCLEVIRGVTQILSVDESKDNPVDTFPFVLYGESVLASIKESGTEIATLQNQLALRYSDLGAYGKAKYFLELVLETYIQHLGEEHSWVSISRSNLALRYQALGDYSKASGLLELALASAMKSFGEDHPGVSTMRSNLATVYRALGEYSKASGLLELALASNLKSFGEDHPSVAISRSNLALVYKALGDYSKASGLLELALASAMKSFGEDHPSVARSRSNLALVYKDLGEYSKASGLLELALASVIKSFGEDHPSVAISRSNLALVYKALGDYSKAAGLLELALASDIKSFGEDHPQVAIYRSNLALVYQDLGDYSKATGLLELALASDVKSFGEDHPSTARSRWNLATVYLDLGKKDMAKKLLALAYGTFLKLLGPEHPHTEGVKSWLDKYFG